MLLPDLPLIRVLLDFPPGQADAPALLQALEETRLSPLEAAHLVRALLPGGTLSLQALRLLPALSPASLEVWRKRLPPSAPADARFLLDRRPLLALLAGALHLRRAGFSLPEPSSLPAPKPPVPQGWHLAVVQGLPFHQAYREALRLAEAAAHQGKLHGVHLATLTRLGAVRAHQVLLTRWEGMEARPGSLPGSFSNGGASRVPELLAPFTASPVDVVLRGVTGVADAPLRLLAFALKAVVLPVPLDSPRLYAALRVYLAWRRALNLPTVLVAPFASPRVLAGLLPDLPLPPSLPAGVALFGEGEPILLPLTREAAPSRRTTWILPSMEEAQVVYDSLPGVPEGDPPLFRRTPEGRAMLFHGSLRLDVLLAREEAFLASDLLIGTESALLEAASARNRLKNPGLAALLHALAEGEAEPLWPEPFPRRRPEAQYALLRDTWQASPSPSALLALWGREEFADWRREKEEEIAPRLVPPERWPESWRPEALLREGPQSIFLLEEDLEALKGVRVPAYRLNELPEDQILAKLGQGRAYVVASLPVDPDLGWQPQRR